MNSTILFFSDFGRAIHRHGEINAIIEQPMVDTGKSAFTIHYTNESGQSLSIHTSCDFYIYEGKHSPVKPVDWTGFSRTDLFILTEQVPNKALAFARTGFDTVNRIHESKGLTDLLPAPKPIPKEKRVIGNLITGMLAQAS